MARKTVTFSQTGLFSSSTVTDFTAPTAKTSAKAMSELSDLLQQAVLISIPLVQR